MSKSRVLKESRAVYTLPLNPARLAEGPIILEQRGQPVAVVIAPEEYKAYRAWREADAWRQAELEKLQPGREAFQHLLPELLKTHRDQFVALYRGQVVDADADSCTLAERVHARGYRPVYIQLVSPQPRTIELPSPEEVIHVAL